MKKQQEALYMNPTQNISEFMEDFNPIDPNHIQASKIIITQILNQPKQINESPPPIPSERNFNKEEDDTNDKPPAQKMIEESKEIQQAQKKQVIPPKRSRKRYRKITGYRSPPKINRPKEGPLKRVKKQKDYFQAEAQQEKQEKAANQSQQPKESDEPKPNKQSKESKEMYYLGQSESSSSSSSDDDLSDDDDMQDDLTPQEREEGQQYDSDELGSDEDLDYGYYDDPEYDEVMAEQRRLQMMNIMRIIEEKLPQIKRSFNFTRNQRQRDASTSRFTFTPQNLDALFPNQQTLERQIRQCNNLQHVPQQNRSSTPKMAAKDLIEKYNSQYLQNMNALIKQKQKKQLQNGQLKPPEKKVKFQPHIGLKLFSSFNQPVQTSVRSQLLVKLNSKQKRSFVQERPEDRITWLSYIEPPIQSFQIQRIRKKDLYARKKQIRGLFTIPELIKAGVTPTALRNYLQVEKLLQQRKKTQASLAPQSPPVAIIENQAQVDIIIPENSQRQFMMCQLEQMLEVQQDPNRLVQNVQFQQANPIVQSNNASNVTDAST